MAADPTGSLPAPLLEGRSGAAAFFDLDRTLMEGSSAFQFGRAAYRHGLMSRKQLLADAWANILFRVRGSTDGGTEALRDRISDALQGVRVRELERLGVDVLAGVLPRIDPDVLAIAYHHQDEGRKVFIVTAAADELAQMLAHVLSFDGAIGTRFSTVRDGAYTGLPAGPFIYHTGKADAIRALAAERKLDLAESYAYSDSESDLPMLEAVGHPVVVNPDKALLKLARERGWQVLRFDRLGRRLKAAGALAGASTSGGVVAAIVLAVRARRPPPSRGRRWAQRGRLRPEPRPRRRGGGT
ncbi:MAG: HAD family hydrolase [Solirubrobacteraceae bacterium]